MSGVSRQFAIFGLLKAVCTPADNPMVTVGVGSRVKPDWKPQKIAVVADQSQAAAIAANVESESPVDEPQ